MQRFCLLLGLLVFGCTDGNAPTSPGIADPKAGRYSLMVTEDSTSLVSTGTLTISGPAGATSFAVAITSSDITVQPSMTRDAGSPWLVFATVGGVQKPVRLALSWTDTTVICVARYNLTLFPYGPCTFVFQGP